MEAKNLRSMTPSSRRHGLFLIWFPSGLLARAPHAFRYARNKMTRKQLIPLILFLTFPSVAYAHGEDILVPIWGQLAVLISSIIYISVYESEIKEKILIISVVLISIVVAWALTGNMPFTENFIYITTVDIALPLTTGLLAIALLKLKKSHK